ncbi:MAG: hypothetical protein IT310_03630 [Anaerolineales bacterium]|nr:hypothetical protein [Anaerolineales bacterium]
MSKKIILLAFCVALLAAGLYLYRFFRNRSSPRTDQILAWFYDETSLAEYRMKTGAVCGDAPFRFPTDGLIGFIWDDSFRPGHRHSGIDIFGGTGPGVVSIYTAYPGYLTRQADWKSSVIVRAPQDPLKADRQIWVYYTHMADAQGNSFISDQFPPGTSEVFVEAGTYLGLMGNYSGNPAAPVGVHLHVSVVKDDGLGNFTNELDIRNTYDPSPYFGLPLNANENSDTIPFCE